MGPHQGMVDWFVSVLGQVSLADKNTCTQTSLSGPGPMRTYKKFKYFFCVCVEISNKMNEKMLHHLQLHSSHRSTATPETFRSLKA